MKKLILLILLIPSILFAGPLQQAHKKVIAAGQTVDEGSSFLVGSDTSYTTNSEQVGDDEAAGWDGGYIATGTGTLSKGYAYSAGPWTATAMVMLVYDSSRDLIATSSPINVETEWVDETWVEFTFSSGPTITTGNTYYILLIANGYFEIYTTGSAGDFLHDTSGTYASPPETLGTSTVLIRGPKAMYLEK